VKFISSTNKSTTRSSARFLSFLRGEVWDFAFLGCHASGLLAFYRLSVQHIASFFEGQAVQEERLLDP